MNNYTPVSKNIIKTTSIFDYFYKLFTLKKIIIIYTNNSFSFCNSIIICKKIRSSTSNLICFTASYKSYNHARFSALGPLPLAQHWWDVESTIERAASGSRGKSSAHLETSSPLVNTKERTSKAFKSGLYWWDEQRARTYISHDYTRAMHQQVQVALLSCMCVCVSPSYPFYLFLFQTLLPFKCNDLFVAEGLRHRGSSAEKVLPSHFHNTRRRRLKTSNRTATRTNWSSCRRRSTPAFFVPSLHSNSPHRHLLGSNDPSPAIQVTDFTSWEVSGPATLWANEEP